MPAQNFRFVSPGVLTNEIDNSETPQVNIDQIGPVIVGRSHRGPANRPVQVQDFEEFVSIFGEPQAGGGVQNDVWRDGNNSAPTYGAYAAEAWLRNSRPVTFVRLLGSQHTNAIDAGRAGWQTDNTVDSSETENGGAYGLFVVDKAEADDLHLDGGLGAIFYIQNGSITLTGSNRDGDLTDASAELVESVGDGKLFKAVIRNGTGDKITEASFNFNPSSDKYIRKVFNTNPILTNNDILDSSNTTKYWLGESFERHVNTLVTSSTAGNQYGVIFALSGPNGEGGDFRYDAKHGKTGWIFSQDLSADPANYDPRDQQKLFRIHSLYGGEWASKNIKISLSDIKPSSNDSDPYGTFSVLVRSAGDTDESPVILEQFNGCDLNPNSPDFIGAKIGTKRTEWDDTDKRYREYGVYANNSRYIRVELNETVLDGMHNPALLPFGVFGPMRHRPFAIISGSTTEVSGTSAAVAAQTSFEDSFVQGGSHIPRTGQVGTEFVNVGTAVYSASFHFPEIPLRAKATDGSLPDPKKAFYGINPVTSQGSTKHDKGYVDYVRSLSNGYEDLSENSLVEHQWIFSLDDVSGSALTAAGEYVSGSRVDGDSLSAVYGWEDVLENNHNRFTSPLYGGFDGFDVTEMEPLRNSLISSTPTEETDSIYYTYKRSIDAIRDPEIVDVNLACIPGLTNEALTGLLAKMCESRGDALAVIDPKGGYTARAESAASFSSRIGDTQTIVNNMKQRGLNTSYAATYDPWLQIRDGRTGIRVFVPPSVVAVGSMAKTDRDRGPWFAPAGFTRAGLSKGDSGLDVISVTRKLLKDDRDDLYTARINPIASLPDVGITIWGQKTLLPSKTSALNRVNVRRMMLYIKKAISQVAAQTIFEPNVEDTWQSFKSSANPILDDVQSRFGINEFKLKLDRSTTTPDLIDRNIVYAKVLVKPTRAIEFFAIDFVLSNSGASFDD